MTWQKADGEFHHPDGSVVTGASDVTRAVEVLVHRDEIPRLGAQVAQLEGKLPQYSQIQELDGQIAGLGGRLRRMRTGWSRGGPHWPWRCKPNWP